MKHRGVFEKVFGSGEWWIRYADATGHIRRERVGEFDGAEARLKLRKEEAKLGTLPRLAWRRRPVLFRKIAGMRWRTPTFTSEVRGMTTIV
jgi:hypothetical protein